MAPIAIIATYLSPQF